MGIIRILDELVANKIAAGEVVERPAAVVKELVENSLDAGAETIEVRVHKGGKAFIQVVDDGCGMSREDAELSLERHATSKIATAEDIHAITTLGFRGEALPSIAAVSQFTLITREPTKSEGVKITMEGGKNRSVGVGAAPPGTTVVVKNLFFNSPARRKFQHADTTEFGHIHSSLVATALAHPRIQFRLLHNDHVVLIYCRRPVPWSGSLRCIRRNSVKVWWLWNTPLPISRRQATLGRLRWQKPTARASSFLSIRARSRTLP